VELLATRVARRETKTFFFSEEQNTILAREAARAARRRFAVRGDGAGSSRRACGSVFFVRVIRAE